VSLPIRPSPLMPSVTLPSPWVGMFMEFSLVSQIKDSHKNKFAENGKLFFREP
jgi:hypothetical protein